MMPTAWEEVSGTGLTIGYQTVAGVGGGTDIEWNVGMGLPDGMNAYIAWSPLPDGSKNTNKGTSGNHASIIGHGWDVVITHSGLADGLNVFAGYSQVDQIASLDDRDTRLLGATYAFGGTTIGYQWSKDKNPGVADSTADYYENHAYGISFSVNDDLTLSYGYHESEKKKENTSVTVEGSSLQASYSMGGASIKFAESDVDNQTYSSGTNREGRSIALTLAF
jgi:hypothetical protein